MIEPTGWIVANGKEGGEVRYRSMDHACAIWVDAPEKALRFSRRADAELFAAEDEGAWLLLPYPIPKSVLEIGAQYPAIFSSPTPKTQERVSYPMLHVHPEFLSREILYALSIAPDSIALEHLSLELPEGPHTPQRKK